MKNTATVVSSVSVPASWYEEQEAIRKEADLELKNRTNEYIAEVTKMLEGTGITPISMAFNILKNAIQTDPGYAWSWHCNIAMPIYDSMSGTPEQSHAIANLAAGRVMRHVFDSDTMSDKHSENTTQPQTPV